MKKIEYKNRYGDVYTFTKTEDGNILWEGSFKWSRSSWPNVYDDAYKQYISDGGEMDLKTFKKEVHEAVYDENGKYLHMSETSQKYCKLVYSDLKTIDMVDPSGGPYIHSGHNMGTFSKEFKGMIVKKFERVEEGYLIIIDKEESEWNDYMANVDQDNQRYEDSQV
jgi:hypothetical protein